MPTGKSLLKVLKQVNKSRGAIHPKGRKFSKLNKAHLREHKLGKKKALHLEKREHELKRLLFFQEAVEHRVTADKKTFSLDEAKLFIEAFIGRYDEELEALNSQRRPGRPRSKRQEQIEGQKSKDEEEYGTGFKIPNLADEENVASLMKWNGTIGGTTSIKFHHVAKDSETFPDKLHDVEMATS